MLKNYQVAKELQVMKYPYNVVAPKMGQRAILQYFLVDPDGYYIEVTCLKS